MRTRLESATSARSAACSSRFSRAVWRSWRLRESALTGRPVRPRASIVPAAFPRCLLRRLRFV